MVIMLTETTPWHMRRQEWNLLYLITRFHSETIDNTVFFDNLSFNWHTTCTGHLWLIILGQSRPFGLTVL